MEDQHKEPSPDFLIGDAEKVLAYLQRTSDFVRAWEKMYHELGDEDFRARASVALAQAEEVKSAMASATK